jgi:hypothetical protein
LDTEPTSILFLLFKNVRLLKSIKHQFNGHKFDLAR